MFAEIDAADYSLVGHLDWCAKRDKRTWYAIRSERIDGKKTTVAMHRLIMSATKGQQVDHVDGNGLNNRRGNLRFADNHEQGQNSRIRRNKVHSRFKGVSWANDPRYTAGGRWHVQINVRGVRLQRYAPTEEAAAEIYDQLAREHFGEFAKPNA